MGGACLTIWESHPDRSPTGTGGGKQKPGPINHSRCLWSGPPPSLLLWLYKAQHVSKEIKILQLDVSTAGRQRHIKIALSRWENKSLVL